MLTCENVNHFSDTGQQKKFSQCFFFFFDCDDDPDQEVQRQGCDKFEFEQRADLYHCSFCCGKNNVENYQNLCEMTTGIRI